MDFDNLGQRALPLNDASDLSRGAFVNRSVPGDRKRNSLIPPHPFKGEFIKAFAGTGKFEIDDFFRTRKIRKLDVLHCDIQGFEIEMLQGAPDVLTRRRVHYLFISTHSQEIHAEIVRQVGELGYRVEISSDFEVQTTSFDGFVFASSPDVKPVFEKVSILGREEITQRRPADILKSLALLQREPSLT
jgi:hypothetical protein